MASMEFNKRRATVRTPMAKERSTKSHEAARKELAFRVVSCDFVDRLSRRELLASKPIQNLSFAPTGLCLKARGCRALTATLGHVNRNIFNRNAVAPAKELANSQSTPQPRCG